ncbi:MAG TPA: exodeoxyribonuclease V subunit gamma [Syntrophales bacterium]|nr:exodeoxyribonuclease V subunit gamma [Syntrophales bacterium]
MALYAYTSNRLEILADNLAYTLEKSPRDPLKPEVIVVPSHGMDRWLTFALARRMGMAANLTFPFPRGFIMDILQKLLGEEASDFSRWEAECLTWEVMKLLPRLMRKPAFRDIGHYLSQENSDLSAFELASEIASTFDHYLIYRPEMVSAWLKGKDNHWQAELWREIVKERATTPPTLQLNRLRDEGKKANLPPRVFVFAISSLPPLYLELFVAFSKLFDVHFFLLNPCRQYWGDILTPHEVSSYLNRTPQADAHAEAYHLTADNSLLASLGKRGREFFDLWQEKAALDGMEKEFFVEPGDDTLLHLIQGDILDLRAGQESEKREIHIPDDSIQIHSCHGPMREMEILQDHLLEFLRRDETLKPSDIIVLAPDMSLYAPYVRAVFSLPEEDPRFIPFSIADTPFSAKGISKAFSQIGKLKEGRFRASEVFSLLECPAVRRKFSLTEEELEVISEWIVSSGIRWGKDAEMRKELGGEPLKEGTWQAGQERMLLGYALPIEGENDNFCDIIPFDKIEGSDREMLASLLTFLHTLGKTLDTLKEKRFPAKWAEALHAILDDFFSLNTDEELMEVGILRGAIRDLEATASKSVFREPISAEIAFEYVNRKMRLLKGTTGFLTGGVTFCDLTPMRSIPFRVICLVGMNFQDFPRLTKTPSFDLMALNPRPGDPSRRYDDRYLFLEALLSARDLLYISYSGQSPEDNRKLLPSVVVSELIDYVEKNFSCEHKLITYHRLQAFNPVYFQADSGFFSYSQENMEAACALIKRKEAPYTFLDGAISIPTTEAFPPTVDNLLRFFSHPCRFFVRERLNINLSAEDITLTDEEPFEVDKLTAYQIREYFLKSERDIFHKCLAQGEWPYGAPGRYLYESIKKEGLTIKRQISRLSGGEGESRFVDIEISGRRITGILKNIHPQGLFYVRPGKERGRDFLVAWLMHLIFHAAHPDRGEAKTTMIFLDGRKPKIYTYQRPDDPPEILASLLMLYERGLVFPLKLFPESSMAYAKTKAAEKEENKAREKARDTWYKNQGYRESNDPYHRLCYGEAEPIDEEFCILAWQVWEPLLAHREEIS